MRLSEEREGETGEEVGEETGRLDRVSRAMTGSLGFILSVMEDFILSVMEYHEISRMG